MSHTDQQSFAPQGPGSYHSPGTPPGGPAAPPPPKQKSWFARHKFLTAVLAIVVLIVIAAALGGGDDDAPAGSTPVEDTGAAEAPAQDAEPAADEEADPATDEDAAPTTDEAPAQETAPGIGDDVQDGKFEFTVTGVETGVAEVGDEYLNEQAQGQFVLVHMTVHNIGDQAQMLDGTNQKLVDTQGREHSADGSAAIYLGDTGTFLNDINPGNSVDGTVVFDIPADAEPASIILHDSMFSGGVTVSLAG